MKTLIEHIAGKLSALRNCEQSGNQEWAAKHLASLRQLEDLLPSGSGFDSGSTLVRDAGASWQERVVIATGFHHMDAGGSYDGWTEHTLTVTPSFIGGFNIKVSGRDRDGIKDYIAEAFSICLSEHYREVHDGDATRFVWVSPTGEIMKREGESP